MFFRGRLPEQSIWKRFRTGTDGFTFLQEADYYQAHVVANAERVTDLFHALTEQLPPAVDVAVEDVRGARVWTGVDVGLPDVREAIARLKVPLAVYGGVELSVYTSEDQLTLTPDLELYVFARTDRWLYILQGKGLVETVAPAPEAWRLRPDELGPAPELTDALGATAERLGLGAQ
jgi:hypothetical protein